LRPNYRKLEIRFRAPYFTSPENVQFRYQLDGFDEGWVTAGAQSNASYPGLAVGTYVFRVTACNELGIWNEQAATLKIKVTPFFWQTAWFRLALLGGLTALVMGTVRYVSFRRLRKRMLEMERQSALDRERARIARDMHDTLGASLTQINFLGAAASRETMPAEQVREQVAKITRSSQGLVQQLDEIVWAVDPENDTLEGLATYISQFATEFFMDGPVLCRVKVPALLPEIRLTTEVRHNLFLAVREALNNVARHSGAAEATVNLGLEGERVIIVIEDNGRGFDVAAATRRHGQVNLRQRLEEIGGTCQVESHPGSGTTITLHWPRQDP
jgi:signal transduction histidine kinase